jgi:hypothetical protein
LSRDETQQTQYDERASLPESIRKYARDPYAHIWVAGLFLVFTVVMTWPLVLNMRDTLVTWGDPVFQAWTMAWNVHAWTTNPLDVFNANVLYPYRNTLAYSDHLFGQTIMVAPIMLLTDNPILVDNISRFIALTLTGFFTYLLVYDITGNRLAGIVAGFAYAFIPNRMAHIEHLNILTAQWMPLALLAARRALIQRSTRWAVVLGVVLFIQGISGVYFLYFTGILLGVVFVTYLLWDRTRTALIIVGKMIGICAIAALLLVPTLWPYQVVSQDLGIERTREDVDLWSASRSDYFAVNPSNRLYGRVLAERHHRHLEQDLFPGVILVMLATVGLFYRRLPWERWMLFTLALFTFVLSFGFVITVLGREIPNPYQLFYEIVPGFRAIRVAARFGGQLMTLGLVGLAGLGVALITQQIRQFITPARLQSSAVLGLGVLLIAGIGLEYSTRMNLPGPLPTSLEEAERPDYAWMAENPAPAIELPMGEGDVASAWPNYWSTMHWNDVVNGYSAIAPPVYYVFRDRMDRFPDAGTVELLQGMGVETVVYHPEMGVAPEDDPVVQAVEDVPELTEEIGPPDYVWTLDPDPWMWRLVAEVSDGEPVDLPAFQTDLPLFGMLAAILQRESHTVYGEGMLDYWDIPEAPDDVCYVIIPSDQNPGDWGYDGASQVHEDGPLILLRRADCEGS